MEVLNSNVGLFSNFEVLQSVQAQAPQKSRKGQRQDEARSESAWIKQEVLAFLATEPCHHYKSEDVSTFLQRIKVFAKTIKGGFLISEILQFLNLRPTSEVEIYSMVECCSERLTETQVPELIAIITETLPTSPES